MLIELNCNEFFANKDINITHANNIVFNLNIENNVKFCIFCNRANWANVKQMVLFSQTRIYCYLNFMNGGLLLISIVAEYNQLRNWDTKFHRTQKLWVDYLQGGCSLVYTQTVWFEPLKYANTES